nr:DUF4010 domain-containing protein [Lysobacter enzymogenes]
MYKSLLLPLSGHDGDADALYVATRLTTEAAWLLTFLIGALAMREAAVSAALGVALAILLAAREHLHRFSRHWIGHEELRGLLLLAACAFIVLPLLPDRALDPWGAINPHQLWTLAVGVMIVSAAGYLATRVLGARAGLPIAGLAGGFVSSTATVAAMAERARIQPSLAPLAASAALMSNIATVLQLALVLGLFSPALLAWAVPALAGAGLVPWPPRGWPRARLPPTPVPVRRRRSARTIPCQRCGCRRCWPGF